MRRGKGWVGEKVRRGWRWVKGYDDDDKDEDDYDDDDDDDAHDRRVQGETIEEKIQRYQDAVGRR